MKRQRKVTAGGRSYIVDVTEEDGKWTAGVVPISGAPGLRPIWTSEAASEEELQEQLDLHFAQMKAAHKQNPTERGRNSTCVLLFLAMMWGRLALGQTQAQVDMVNVYGAYLPLECGMEMVAKAYPTLAERANAAKSGVQTAFSRTLAYIDKAMTSGTPNGATKWPELKRNTRRQMPQLLSVPSDAESATEVIMNVEQAAKGDFPPTLRKHLELLPASVHPLNCKCAKCAKQPNNGQGGVDRTNN